MSIKEFREKRKLFNTYPPFLLHTLFHGSQADKIRQADFGNAFFIFDDLKQEGNLYYEDKNYYQAINLYEQVE